MKSHIAILPMLLFSTVVFAETKCCDDQPYESETYACCDTTIYDSTHQTPESYNANLSVTARPVIGLLNSISSTQSNSPISGPSLPTIAIQKAEWKLCCDEDGSKTIRDFSAYSGSISINGISASKSWPGPYSLPYLAEWGINFSISGNVAGTVSGQPDCEHPDELCANVNITAVLSGNLYASAVGNFVLIQGGAGASGGWNGTWCRDKDFTGQICGDVYLQYSVLVAGARIRHKRWPIGHYCSAE